ncbi:hypothetical protein AN936_07125 [Sphingopyxis macrogoltabida]|uniref:Uncharacterized protein n=1 Tax=Sphingopyxis macrogoltabida TaxID=33050 RepID=A0A0N9U4T6_SPHMC|nr:hypothetical protein AN936_07125 [Sphingopyxis macrogoltabida]
MQADVPGAPSIIKTNIQEMRAYRHLGNDAGLVQKIARIGETQFLNREGETLAVPIANCA